MSGIDPILFGVAGVVIAAMVAWALWDDLMTFLDPRGEHERGLRRGGLSDRAARSRRDATSPIYYGLVSGLGLLGLLTYFN